VKAGDTLIYGNGHRVQIVNLLTMNGAPAVQVDDPMALFAGDRFKSRVWVESLIHAGIWKIEPAATQPKEG
jgi:hypothetical protein